MQPRETAEFVNAIRRKLFNVDDEESVVGLDKGFLLTKHVAWQLRDFGYFLVKAKPGSENNADGYTSDIIAKQSGFHVDILIDSGRQNRGTWQPNHNEDHWAAIRPRLAHPIDVGDCFSGEQPQIDDNNTAGLQEQIDELKARLASLMAQRPVLEGSIISLRSNNADNPHPWVCADGNQGNRLIANRDELHSWEEFYVVIKK